MNVSIYSTSQILLEPSSRLILLPYLLIPFPLVPFSILNHSLLFSYFFKAIFSFSTASCKFLMMPDILNLPQRQKENSLQIPSPVPHPQIPILLLFPFKLIESIACKVYALTFSLIFSSL